MDWTRVAWTSGTTKENKQKLVLPLLYGITIEQLTKKYPQLGEIQCISAMTYSKGKIAILLAKELIRRYKAIGGKKLWLSSVKCAAETSIPPRMKLPARARTPKQNSPNLHHNVFLLCYNTPLHSPADTNYFMRQSGASSWLKKISRYYGFGWVLAVRCYCGFRILLLPVCKASPGKRNSFPPT